MNHESELQPSTLCAYYSVSLVTLLCDRVDAVMHLLSQQSHLIITCFMESQNKLTFVNCASLDDKFSVN